MIRRCLPLVSLPKLTMPERSARIAGSFGLRASNRSATRGRPPVMSRVFDVSCGIRATTSPTPTSAPFCSDTIAPAGRKYCAGMSVPGRLAARCPSCRSRRTIGRRSFACAPRRFGSVTTARRQTGQLVGLLLHGDAVDEVDEADHAGHFRNDRMRMRIPVRDGLAGLDRPRRP